MRPDRDDEKMNRRAADTFKFVDEFFQRNVRMVPVQNPWILIEAGKRGGVISCKDESAVSEDSLRIDDMADEFLHCTFIRAVPIIAFCFIETAQR